MTLSTFARKATNYSKRLPLRWRASHSKPRFLVAEVMSRLRLNLSYFSFRFLFDSNAEPVIVEIIYSSIDHAVYDCPGHWDWDLDLNWRQGHFWPQYRHLVDLLNLPELDYQE